MHRRTEGPPPKQASGRAANRSTRSPSGRRALFTLVVLAAAVGTAGSALAVDVRGALRIASGFAGETPPVSEEEARRLWYWNEWNGFFEPRDLGFEPARDLAVVLRGEGAMAEDQPGFRIANGGLYPTTLVARAGATLRIHNTDPCAHQLFAEGHSELNPTPTSPGLTRQVVVTEAGSWALQDQLYAHVTGHLHVIDDLVARATIDDDGSYRFQNVPEGTYTLAIYRGADVVHTQEGIEVTDRELTLDAISLRPGAGSGSEAE